MEPNLSVEEFNKDKKDFDAIKKKITESFKNVFDYSDLKYFWSFN